MHSKHQNLNKINSEIKKKEFFVPKFFVISKKIDRNKFPFFEIHFLFGIKGIRTAASLLLTDKKDVALSFAFCSRHLFKI